MTENAMGHYMRSLGNTGVLGRAQEVRALPVLWLQRGCCAARCGCGRVVWDRRQAVLCPMCCTLGSHPVQYNGGSNMCSTIRWLPSHWPPSSGWPPPSPLPLPRCLPPCPPSTKPTAPPPQARLAAILQKGRALEELAARLAGQPADQDGSSAATAAASSSSSSSAAASSSRKGKGWPAARPPVSDEALAAAAGLSVAEVVQRRTNQREAKDLLMQHNTR